MSDVGFRVARDEASAEFFDAAEREVLLLRRCSVCGAIYAPHRVRCRDSDTLDWVESSGRGVLVTWAVEFGPLDPVLAGPDPRTAVFGYVELAEGPWLQVPLVETGATTLAAGLPMVVTFVRPGGGEPMPAFRPA